MDIIYSLDSLRFKKPGHPEAPERIDQASRYLRNKGYNFEEAQACKVRDLLSVHELHHVEKVKENNFYDPDSPNYNNIFRFATVAAGAAIAAARLQGLSLLRPPGHHAGPGYVKGFCYFNNLAIAVEKLGKKTLIVDFDGHHGNGTQDIFYGREDVVYLSLHKATFPGTGRSSHENCYNHVFNTAPGDDNYLAVLADKLEEVQQDYDEFELVAVSAGFDAYSQDPLASLGLSPEGFYRIGCLIGELDLPTFSVLEGGYVADMLGENIHNYLQGLRGLNPPDLSPESK